MVNCRCVNYVTIKRMQGSLFKIIKNFLITTAEHFTKNRALPSAKPSPAQVEHLGSSLRWEAFT